MTTTNPHCPVAQLARLVHLNIEAVDLAEVGSFEAGRDRENKAKLAFDRKREALDEHRYGIEAWASHLLATGGTGILFQIGLIAALAREIEAAVPIESEWNRKCVDAGQALNRLCYSVQSYVAATSGANPDDACGDYYLSPASNPHRLADAAAPV